jgi:hypothetical protein
LIKDEGIVDPEEEEMNVPKPETETEAEINNRIDTTWEQVKKKHIKEQAQEEEIEKLDGLWNNEALVDEFMSQIPVKSEQTAISPSILRDPLVGEEIPSSQTIAEVDLSLFEDQTAASSLSSVENASTRSSLSNIPSKTITSCQKKRNRTEDQTSSEALRKSRRLSNGSTKKLVTENVNTTNNNIPNQQESIQEPIITIKSKESLESIDQDQDNYWASDSEEDMDLDFLANIQSYF